MKNYIEQLKTSPLASDLLLAQFLESENCTALVNAQNMGERVNRGDCFEMGLTHEPVRRDGLHQQSKGDTTFKGEPVEVKYLTKKTKASIALKGTIARFHLIGFNDGKTLDIRLIPTKSLKVTKDGRLKYQDNIDMGVSIRKIVKA